MNTTESHYHQLQPGVLLNKKYRVEKVLGEGGFGITYLAVDTVLELTVAIKEYYLAGYVTREVGTGNTVMPFSGEKKDIFEEGKRKFIKEARSLGKLAGQKGIVAVRDYFEENNTAYIVMEYLDGITLKAYLKQVGGKLSVEDTLELVKPVIRSLIEVHKQGLIHRDISPDNIMVMPGNTVKLLDFGAAREVSVNGEKSLSVLLKPGYAPEEQYRTRGEQGPWSDIYALCATVYRCITGSVPAEAMERIRNDVLKPPSAMGIAINRDKERILMQGIALFKEKRIQSAEELYEGWYGALDAETGVVSEISGKRSTKLKRRKRKEKVQTTLTIGAVAVGVLAIGLFLLLGKKADIAEMPGDMTYSSAIVATRGDKIFVRQQNGLLWGFANSERGIQQASTLFSDVNVGDVMLGEDDKIYMVFPGVGLICFDINGNGGIEYLVNDAVENTFLMTQDAIFYVKESDSYLYKYSFEQKKEKLVLDVSVGADAFTIYENVLWYYTKDGGNGDGIYTLNLENNKIKYMKESKLLREICCLRSGSKTIYAVDENGTLYTLHAGDYSIMEEVDCNINTAIDILPVEKAGAQGIYYVERDGNKICFYDRINQMTETTITAEKEILYMDYVDERLFFVLSDGSFSFITQKGAVRQFSDGINYFD
ncbi:MAG: serine/threonine protein kinase [Clostridia bacterium]|nr:serine/threonine protein kinase [Clostridia bacterium]